MGTLYLTEEQWKKFIEMLEAPPRPLPNLTKLMKTKSPWETDDEG